MSDDGGMGGTPRELCTFHTSAGPGTDEAGAAGATGSIDVGLTKSVTIGNYLTDGHGHALYVYGADVPGDCRTPPVAACIAAPCTQTWEAFSADDRELAAGIDDASFGDFKPVGGMVASQSSYNGWPLYTFVNEVPGSLGGQGKAQLYFAVTVPFYNVMLMKKKVSAAVSIKYISDGTGYALYESSADPKPAAGAKPVSNCTGACAAAWPPFIVDSLILPSSFAQADFSIFKRADGELQVAYRGSPLYRFDKDANPGDTLGDAVSTFVLADPALTP